MGRTVEWDARTTVLDENRRIAGMRSRRVFVTATGVRVLEVLEIRQANVSTGDS